MRYSTEPRKRKYIEGYFFLKMGMSFARKFEDKYGKTLVITATKIGKGAAKIASKRIVQKNSRSNRKLDSR